MGGKNMVDKFVRKGLVIGIIFLFIGAGVYPAIAVKLNTSTNTVQDEKSSVNAKKIEKPLDLPCNCEKDNTTGWYPEKLCVSLFYLFIFLWGANLDPFAGLIYYIMELLNCPLEPLFQNI
jgi:hypothetical protein